MYMQIKLNKWGNSWAIRLPATYLKELNINPDTPVEIGLIGDMITISKKKRPTLEELVAGITEENRHDLIDFGPPVGKEIW